MWELDCEKGWGPKNWCFWTVVLEKTLESPLDCKEIQPVHSEGDQPWDFFGWNDAKAESPVLWPPHVKSWLIGKDSDAGRDWGAWGEGDDRGWDGWMASLTWWTWVSVNSGSWWWTGRLGVLQFIGSQRVRQDWATELNWTAFCGSPGPGPSYLTRASDPGSRHVLLLSAHLTRALLKTSHLSWEIWILGDFKQLLGEHYNVMCFISPAFSWGASTNSQLFFLLLCWINIWNLPLTVLEWKWKSEVAQSCPTFCDPWL